VTKRINIANVFPKHLFWDVDHSSLDVQQDKDLIIPRAMYATNETSFETDITRLESLYTREDITHHLRSTKEMVSNEVCLMVANRYNIEPFYRFKQLQYF